MPGAGTTEISFDASLRGETCGSGVEYSAGAAAGFSSSGTGFRKLALGPSDFTAGVSFVGNFKLAPGEDFQFTSWVGASGGGTTVFGNFGPSPGGTTTRDVSSRTGEGTTGPVGHIGSLGAVTTIFDGLESCGPEAEMGGTVLKPFWLGVP